MCSSLLGWLLLLERKEQEKRRHYLGDNMSDMLFGW